MGFKYINYELFKNEYPKTLTLMSTFFSLMTTVSILNAIYKKMINKALKYKPKNFK